LTLEYKSVECWHMKQKLIFSIPSDQIPYGISLYQRGHKNFTVVYGSQVKNDLSYSEAAKEFGLSLLHALNCDGKLD
jgi:hypothetical protein